MFRAEPRSPPVSLPFEKPTLSVLLLILFSNEANESRLGEENTKSRTNCVFEKELCLILSPRRLGVSSFASQTLRGTLAETPSLLKATQVSPLLGCHCLGTIWHKLSRCDLLEGAAWVRLRSFQDFEAALSDAAPLEFSPSSSTVPECGNRLETVATFFLRVHSFS